MTYQASFVTRSDYASINDLLTALTPGRTGRTTEWIDGVFGQWMDEQLSRTYFAKVTQGRHVVGVGAVRFESERDDVHQEATIEGFRVHPEHRAGNVLRYLLGYTIGAGIHHRVLAARSGSENPDETALVVRALVATDNLYLLDSLRRSDRFYKEVVLQEMEHSRQNAVKGVDFGVRPVPVKETDVAWAEYAELVRARESRRVALWEHPRSPLTLKDPGAGFLFRDFALLELTRERFGRAVEEGCVLDCQDRVNGQRVGGFLIVSPREMGVRLEATTQVQAMAIRQEFTDSHLTARSHDVLIRAALDVAARRDHRLMFGPYLGDQIVQALHRHGFAPDRWHQTVVLRKTLTMREARRLLRHPPTLE